MVTTTAGDLVLLADVDALDDHYEVACSVLGEDLKCSPWPEVTQVVDNRKHSALTLILLAPPTKDIPSSSVESTGALSLITPSSCLELALDQ